MGSAILFFVVNMKRFIIDTAERAVKTAAQTAIAAIGTTHLISAVDWKTVLSTSLLAAILSILTSIASKPVGDTNSASIIKCKAGK